MKRFARNGGAVVRKRITDLDAFVADSEYDVIVNCSGLGSRTLLKDNDMYAVRGQVSRVRGKAAGPQVGNGKHRQAGLPWQADRGHLSCSPFRFTQSQVVYMMPQRSSRLRHPRGWKGG